MTDTPDMTLVKWTDQGQGWIVTENGLTWSHASFVAVHNAVIDQTVALRKAAGEVMSPEYLAKQIDDWCGRTGHLVVEKSLLTDSASRSTALAARVEALEKALRWIEKKAADKRNPAISFVAHKALAGEELSPLRGDAND